MKRKLTTLLLVFACVLTCALCFTACGEEEHTHKFNQQVATETYLSTAATCEEKATYYYSCACGEKGTETFESGVALGHDFNAFVSNGNGTHTKICRHNSEHTEKAKCQGEATCTQAAPCKYCGADFYATHTYSKDYSYNDTHHWRNATCGCDLRTDESIHTSSPSGKCPLCGLPNEVTDGVVYDLAGNNSYAEVIDYTGTATTVRIASTYEGVPVKGIYDDAFRETSITEIFIPDTVESIGDRAFSNCYSLTEVVIPDSVTSIGDHAFYFCESLTEIVIPDSVTSIGSYAFYNCFSLTEVVIPDSVTSIGSYAFYWCYSLTEVVIGNSVTSIGSSAFYACYSLTEVVIPDSVTSIGSSAFSYCYSLTEVVIPDSVTSIGSSAFSWCTSLTEVVIPDSVTSIGDRAFFGDSLQSITVGTNNTAYKSIDGNLYTKDGKTLVQYAIGKTATLFVMPDSVTSIGSSAFRWCFSLTEVVIPDSVTSIGDSAFADCYSLQRITVDANNMAYKSIGGNLYTKDGKTLVQYAIGKTATLFVIPDNVTSIGEYAFYNCDSLIEVVIGNGVTSIGDSAFYSCDSLTDVVIPDSVTSIGDSAFRYCDSLTDVVIPDSVTSIGGYAFFGCNSLTTINYTGTEEQWNAITKGSYWYPYSVDYTVVYNYQG